MATDYEKGVVTLEASVMQTGWSEERVRRFLQEEHLGYQRIELPYGFSTGGEDRSRTSRQIFPPDMRGKSVLDIGTSHGYFCFEALKRGATRAVGVDVDPENVRKSRLIADCLGSSAEFQVLDIDEDGLDEQFDYVLALNLLHHVKNPIAVLDKLIRATRERLILEMAGLGRHERRKLRSLRGMGFLLARSPVIVVGRQGASNFAEQRFFMTPPAVENLLLHQRPVFATVATSRSQFKDRFLTVAEKRRIDNLIVVAGPTSVGKDHFIERVRVGELPQIARELDVGDLATWPVVGPRSLKQLNGASAGVVLHYDFLRPYLRSAKTHNRDEALDVLQVAKNVKFVTLIAPPHLLRERIEESEIRPKTSGGTYRGPSRYLKLRQEYEKPAHIRRFYERWLDFSRNWSGQHILVSYGEDISVAGIDEWESVAEANKLSLE